MATKVKIPFDVQKAYYLVSKTMHVRSIFILESLSLVLELKFKLIKHGYFKTYYPSS
jgi:hypothetical protein